MGHRATSSKCSLNGTKKKRKSRAKQGRPLGSTSGTAGPSTPKQQKKARSDSTGASPGPVTRRQLKLIQASGEGSSQMATPSRPPRAAKKITPKKGKNESKSIFKFG